MSPLGGMDIVEQKIDHLTGLVENMASVMGVLQSDVGTLKSDVGILKSDVSTLKSDVSELKSDVSGLKSDVSTLKSDVSGLKTDVSDLKTDVRNLTDVVDHLAITMLDHQVGLDDLRDRMGRVEHNQERTFNRMDEFLLVLNRHDTEIVAGRAANHRLEERLELVEQR